MADDKTGSQTTREQARRRILKRLVAGGGIVATERIIPQDWHRPVVESVILPAHAQTSPGTEEDKPTPENTMNMENTTNTMNTIQMNSTFLFKNTDSSIS